MDEQQFNPEQPNASANQPEMPIVPPESPAPEPVPTPVVPAAPASEPIVASQPQSVQSQPSKTKTLDTDTKVFAAISYLSILFVVPWVAKREDQFVAFHLKQGMALFFAEAVVWVVLRLVESFLTTVFSYHIAGLILWLNKLAWIVFAVMSLLGIYYAWRGETKALPYLEPITKNIKL